MKNPLTLIGALIIVVGLAIVILSMFLSPAEMSGELEETSGNTTVAWGGCIIIFFIPVCFGGGNPALYPWLMIFSMILSIITIIVMIAVVRRLASRTF